MKHLKMSGLVILAATALSVLFGVGSASATVLCKNNTNPCSAPYGMAQEIDAELEAGTPTFIRSGVLVAECTASTIKGEIAKAGGAAATVTGPITELTFGNCDCAIVVNLKGNFEIHHIEGSPNGLVKSQLMTLTVTCNGITCRFLTSEKGAELGILTGSSNFKGATATLDVHASLTTEKNSSTACNSQATWEGSYLVKTPDYLDVADS
ncbi:MAG: hypothetical protein ACTHO8_05205 [Solirubrobacterales bacterium]